MRKAQINPKSRQKLLNAAERLMLAKGYTATSIEEICEQVHLTKGSFFHYFQSKEEVAKAVLESFRDRSKTRMNEICCKEEPDPLKRIYAYINFMMGFSRDRETQGCLVGALTQELADTHPRIRAICSASFKEWAEILKRDLNEAKRRYRPKSDIDASSLAQHFLAILEGSEVLAKAHRDKTVIKRNMIHFKNYLQALFGKQS